MWAAPHVPAFLGIAVVLFAVALLIMTRVIARHKRSANDAAAATDNAPNTVGGAGGRLGSANGHGYGSIESGHH